MTLRTAADGRGALPVRAFALAERPVAGACGLVGRFALAMEEPPASSEISIGHANNKQAVLFLFISGPPTVCLAPLLRPPDL